MYEFYATFLHSLLKVVVLDFDVLRMLRGRAGPCDGDGSLIVHLVKDIFRGSMSEIFNKLWHPLCAAGCDVHSFPDTVHYSAFLA